MANPTEDQGTKARLAREAERLRTDEPFAEAMKTAYADATTALAAAKDSLVDAVLKNEPIGPAAHEVRLQQAKIEALSSLTTEIAALIIRGKPRVLKPVA